MKQSYFCYDDRWSWWETRCQRTTLTLCDFTNFRIVCVLLCEIDVCCVPQKCILWGKFHAITQFCPASFSQKVLSAYYDPIHCGCQMRPSFSSSSTNSSSFKSLAILSTRLWFWFQVAHQSTHHLKEDRQTSHFLWLVVMSTVGPVHSSKAFIRSLHQFLHLFTLLPLFVGLYNSTQKNVILF